MCCQIALKIQAEKGKKLKDFEATALGKRKWKSSNWQAAIPGNAEVQALKKEVEDFLRACRGIMPNSSWKDIRAFARTGPSSSATRACERERSGFPIGHLSKCSDKLLLCQVCQFWFPLRSAESLWIWGTSFLSVLDGEVAPILSSIAFPHVGSGLSSQILPAANQSQREKVGACGRCGW